MMGQSTPFNIMRVMDLIPDEVGSTLRIVDVGCGSGNFGKRIKKRNPEYKLFGFEVFENYRCAKWNRYYESVEICNVINVDFLKDNTYDICLLIDIVEHMSKDDATMIVDYCKLHSNKIIVSCPTSKYTQKAINGNKFEEHLWIPSYSFFHNLGFVGSEFVIPVLKRKTFPFFHGFCKYSVISWVKEGCDKYGI